MHRKEDEDPDPFHWPKRVLTVASAALTLIFVLFCATLFVSVFQIQWRVGKAETSFDGTDLLIRFPINITNSGYYDINDFTISTATSDRNGTVFSAASKPTTIKSQSNATIEHSIAIGIADFFTAHRDYLFNSTELQVTENISLVAGGIVPVSLTINHTMFWGAPLSNLTVQTPTVTVLNYTHVQVTGRLQFANQAAFPVEGNVRLITYSGTQQTASTTYPVNIPAGSACDVTLILIVPVYPQPTGFKIELQTSYFTWEVPISG